MAVMGRTTTDHVERLAGNVLRVARARAGVSQRELAEAAGVPQSTIAKIESATRQPSLPVLARILAAIDLELRITVAEYDAHDDIFDGDVARLTPAQRRARRRAQDEFVGQLRGAQRS
jgi:transcriptional regulator with XRE-family HTH domain